MSLASYLPVWGCLVAVLGKSVITTTVYYIQQSAASNVDVLTGVYCIIINIMLE